MNNIAKSLSFFCGISFFMVLLTPWLASGQYVLSVDEKKVDLKIGEPQTVILTNGHKLMLVLSKKEFLTFDGNYFSFRHKSNFTPNKTDLGDGISQTLMTSPTGTGIIVQEYKSLDPSSLVDTMVHELTKDEIRAGYKKSEKNIEKKITGGKTIKGKLVTTTYKDDEWVRSVFAYGNGDEGVLVVTMIEKSNVEKEREIIDLFWESFALKGM
jgi:hypothetical protein